MYPVSSSRHEGVSGSQHCQLWAIGSHHFATLQQENVMTANTQQEKLRRRGRPPKRKGCAACSHQAVLSVLVLVSSVNLSLQRQASTESVALCADCFGCLGRFLQPVGISFEKVERLLAVPLLDSKGELLTDGVQFINKNRDVVEASFLNALTPRICHSASDFKR